ncbi:adenylate/guanylate cyclase domain-containing protein [Bradyrhizobium sp. USDA 3240]
MGERVERRLAAVLAADVVGYSRLMGADEVGTLAALKAHRREVVDPAIAEHRGRIVKTTGDGMLVEFASAMEAVTCAVVVQDKMAERNSEADPKITFRIGINVGDIIIDGDDIFGDGVNVAARIESECEPGVVCLSEDAFRQVRGKLAFSFDDIGERSLKNIDRPVRIYAVRSAVCSLGATTAEIGKCLPLPDKPSIAVLPFQNMSGDPEQEYFVDGLVEEIITALSRFKSLFVVARNSSFTFKGRAVDIKEVGRRLGVRYVLEGSVRKASGRVRVTGQLIDAVTGAHVWADRFERDLTDIFALQDEVTAAVVCEIQPELLQTEIAMATRRRPENLTAYDFYLRALQHFYMTTRAGLAEAIRLTQRALELDSGFGRAAALAGVSHMNNVLWGYAVDPQFERKEAIRLLRLVLSIDDSDPDTLAFVSLISAYFVGDCESAIEIADRAVSLNPNSYPAWANRGWVYRVAGLQEEAIRSFERAMRMSPVDLRLHLTFNGMAHALIELRRFDEAIVAGKKAQRHNPSFSPAYRCLASAFAHLGRDAEAREAALRLLEVEPTFTISEWVARGGQSNAKLLIEGLRKAGLPE